MSRGERRRLKTQKEREEKLRKQVCSVQIKHERYEERNKKEPLPNRLNMAKSVEEELEDRQNTVENVTFVYSQMLPSLLRKLNRIEDPRNPKKIKHKMTVLFIYGILMFVLNIGSRREANRTMNSILFENLKAMFPQLETMPHADTLARFLEKINVSEIQECMVELVKDLITKKKFKNYLYKKGYIIAIDGTQKFYRNWQWDDKCLQRNVGSETKTEQSYVYVLESILILGNGISLPLYSLFLSNEDWKKGETKQDCERKAFYRLAEKLKKLFRNSRIILSIDGLYACGPVIKTCKKNNWDFMVVLKEDSLKTVWDDVLGLMKITPENRLKIKWGDRDQVYLWANDIDYEYKEDKRMRNLKLNVVICYETWQENHSVSTGEVERKQTRYAWISSKPLNKSNVFERCTKIGRYRWKIENNILTEKHQGYNYEHCYSYTWNAMEGYHYLMKIGHLLNILAANSELLINKVKALGIRGFIEFLKLACSGALLDGGRIRKAAYRRGQWRLVPVI